MTKFKVGDKVRATKESNGQYGITTEQNEWTGVIISVDTDDVFNADIGKAIALGRALGLDVGRFEKEVQPSEVVEGMDVANTFRGRNNVLRVTKVEGNKVWRTNRRYIEMKFAKITDDTEAQY